MWINVHIFSNYITSPTEQHTAAIVYGATLLLNGINGFALSVLLPSDL
jgi:hypothetical protein